MFDGLSESVTAVAEVFSGIADNYHQLGVLISIAPEVCGVSHCKDVSNKAFDALRVENNSLHCLQMKSPSIRLR